MHRILVIGLLALAIEPLQAQEVFVAPSPRTVIATTEQSNSDDPAHTLHVSNNSTVPIIVFGITLSQCENVKYSCGSRRTKIKIGAGRRVNVGRVQARDTEQGFGYRWNFSYHADSSDAKAMAVLREHGIELGGPVPRAVAEDPTPVATEPPQGSMPVVPVSDPVRRMMVISSPADTAPPPPRPASLRFKVGWGSILGMSTVPDKPIPATGSCVDPARTDQLERDARIVAAPWRPAVLRPGFAAVRLPDALRDSVPEATDVLVRFATDTSGAPIPESVSVLESPSGQLSLKVCMAVMSEVVRPARDKNAQPVRAWVQTPIRIERVIVVQ